MQAEGGEKFYKEAQVKSYDEFRRKLEMKIKVYLPEHLTAVFGKQRNKDAVIVREEGTDETLFLFLDDLYREAVKNGVSDEFEIVFDIVMHFENRTASASRASSPGDLLPKEKMFCQAVNADRNGALLENVPHERLHDLAFVVKCETGGDRPVLITDDICEKSGLCKEELFQIVRKNSRREGYQCTTLGAILSGSFPGDIFSPDGLPAYVLRNSRNLYGASALLSDDVLYHVYEIIGESFYVLPSSTHELILVPESFIKMKPLSELKQIVSEVNREVVSEEDYLSDNVYYYDGETQNLELAHTNPEMNIG